MLIYRAHIQIAADAQTVWEVLTNPAGYPEWDPGMIRVEGKIAAAESVKFFTKFNPERAFGVKITEFEPARKMVFTGGMPLGLFKSERSHRLSPAEQGTLFETQEVFSGLLLPVFGKSLPDLTESFEQFAAGLKKQAEG